MIILSSNLHNRSTYDPIQQLDLLNIKCVSLRKDLYKQLTKLKIKSNFQKIASNGAAYNFVKPAIVWEVKLLEFAPSLVERKSYQ